MKGQIVSIDMPNSARYVGTILEDIEIIFGDAEVVIVSDTPIDRDSFTYVYNNEIEPILMLKSGDDFKFVR